MEGSTAIENVQNNVGGIAILPFDFMIANIIRSAGKIHLNKWDPGKSKYLAFREKYTHIVKNKRRLYIFPCFIFCIYISPLYKILPDIYGNSIHP